MARVVAFDGSFEGWRVAARSLAEADVLPEEVIWQPGTEAALLFEGEPAVPNAKKANALRVPAEFLPLAKKVAHHRNPRRFEVLYRTLYRLTHGEPHLLAITVDDDVYALTMMEKAVRRDAHKMKAFVRFRQVMTDGGVHFVAYHRPEHHVLRLVADFFVDRFHDRPWTIMTPEESATWNGEALSFHQTPADLRTRHIATDDDMETFWQTYYSSIFNPARLRLKAMTKEMPKRFWRTLPEAEVIERLTRMAQKRVDIMIDDTREPERSARDFLPEEAKEGRVVSLAQLREAAAGCRGCDICHEATQTVFGEGSADVRLMLIGEQPGDEEDVAGRPFVGPAGRLLMEVLQEVGLPREELYITNAVKHFKWSRDPRGKRRIHSKPSWTEVTACRPWLMAELASLKPEVIVTLGATAARSLLGPDFRLMPNLGRPITDGQHAPIIIPLIHPSALLRISDPALRQQQHAAFAAAFREIARRHRAQAT